MTEYYAATSNQGYTLPQIEALSNDDELTECLVAGWRAAHNQDLGLTYDPS